MRPDYSTAAERHKTPDSQNHQEQLRHLTDQETDHHHQAHPSRLNASLGPAEFR